jgi:hypothetical protein
MDASGASAEHRAHRNRPDSREANDHDTHAEAAFACSAFTPIVEARSASAKEV